MSRWLRFALRVRAMRYTAAATTTVAATGIALQAGYTRWQSGRVGLVPEEDIVVSRRQDIAPDREFTKREQRFLDFASVEYDDVIYMTPNDFLDSLVLDMPRGEPIHR
ncbi:unnamed protein product [Gongylonema pulchrum]|uniref:Uncharacterized protein n=1 Tax=Gongylonema pulchrum TaxID=637853 RepID=A0A183EIU5_9BILA|nr:unnamed protein product [Gongylonema pulchrum]